MVQSRPRCHHGSCPYLSSPSPLPRLSCLYLAFRGSGLSVHFLISPANVHDTPFAHPLLEISLRLYHLRPCVIRPFRLQHPPLSSWSTIVSQVALTTPLPSSWLWLPSLQVVRITFVLLSKFLLIPGRDLSYEMSSLLLLSRFLAWCARNCFSRPQKTVEKTVKPLKSGENVVTSEHNNNGPPKRSGGERERKYHLEQAKLK